MTKLNSHRMLFNYHFVIYCSPHFWNNGFPCYHTYHSHNSLLPSLQAVKKLSVLTAKFFAWKITVEANAKSINHLVFQFSGQLEYL